MKFLHKFWRDGLLVLKPRTSTPKLSFSRWQFSEKHSCVFSCLRTDHSYSMFSQQMGWCTSSFLLNAGLKPAASHQWWGGGGVWGRLFSTGPARSDNSVLLIYICSGWQAHEEIEVQQRNSTTFIFFFSALLWCRREDIMPILLFLLLFKYTFKRMWKLAIIIQIWHRGRGGRPAAPL